MLEHVEISIFFGAPSCAKKFSVAGGKEHARSSVAPVEDRHQKLPKIGFYKGEFAI
jgi:hypothetical protein